MIGFEASMIYTMGSALNRALDEGTEVAVLVDGIWLSGTVAVSDGVGVVLDNGDDHAIARLDQITAIRILSPLPWKKDAAESAARQMPEPRQPG